jgi:hypothetical protein
MMFKQTTIRNPEMHSIGERAVGPVPLVSLRQNQQPGKRFQFSLRHILLVQHASVVGLVYMHVWSHAKS